MDPYASHQKVLQQTLRFANGMPILELGAGDYSTPLIHETCSRTNLIITIDDNKQWLEKFSKNPKYNNVRDSVISHFYLHKSTEQLKEFMRTDTLQYGIVFIDNNPWSMRVEAVKKYKDQAMFVILHDSDFYASHGVGTVGMPRTDTFIGIRNFDSLFKYWVEYFEDLLCPCTLLASNTIPVPKIEGMRVANFNK